MSVKDFKDVQVDELSMVEIASEILKENNQNEMKFDDLFSQVKAIVGDRGDDQMAIFFTDLNTDGSFISLGDNKWGMRAWYPIDSIDEALHEIDESADEEIVAKPVKKTTAKNSNFEDDVIDYNDDDPEDDDLDAVVVDEDGENPEDEEAIVEDIDDDDDDEDEDVAADMNLTEVDQDDLDSDLDEENDK